MSGIRVHARFPLAKQLCADVTHPVIAFPSGSGLTSVVHTGKVRKVSYVVLITRTYVVDRG